MQQHIKAALQKAGVNRKHRNRTLLGHAGRQTHRVPLSDAQRSRLLEKLCAISGKQVQLTEKVDPAVMGGVLLEMEGKRYDNTLRNRLSQLRQVLTSEV